MGRVLKLPVVDKQERTGRVSRLGMTIPSMRAARPSPGDVLVESACTCTRAVSLTPRSALFEIPNQAHQYRSFSGFTCLMQVSTRDEDFIGTSLGFSSLSLSLCG